MLRVRRPPLGITTPDHHVTAVVIRSKAEGMRKKVRGGRRSMHELMSGTDPGSRRWSEVLTFTCVASGR